MTYSMPKLIAREYSKHLFFYRRRHRSSALANHPIIMLDPKRRYLGITPSDLVYMFSKARCSIMERPARRTSASFMACTRVRLLG